MNKKYIILISIIVLLSISLILTILFKDKGFSIPSLKAIDGNIVNIEITKAGKTIKVSKKDGIWLINDEYNANQGMADNMESSIKNISISDIVSRGDTNTISRYSLDSSNVITVFAFDDKNKEVRNLSIGSKAQTDYQVYAQIDKDKYIYIVASDSNLRDLFDKNINDLRHKTITSTIAGNIKHLGITKDNTAYSLNKISPKTTSTNEIPLPSYWQANWNNNESIENTLVLDILYAVSNIEAEGFLNSNNKTNILYEITMTPSEVENSPISITLFSPNSENQYEVSLVGDPTRYFVTEQVAKRIINNIENIL